MRIKKTAVKKRIFLLEFDTQLELTSTFLRFQEHYESPEYKGKVFSLDEFREWYARERGSFSYYTDWNGFNIPSYILKPFFEGRFDPLSPSEGELISLFQGEPHPFYVIGVHGESDQDKLKATLEHEIAHGLFYTDGEYRAKVLAELAKYDLRELKEWLISIGYHEDVLDDECHAYALTGSSKMKLSLPEELKGKIRELFDRHSDLQSA